MRIGRTIKMGVATATAVAVIAVPTAFAQSPDASASESPAVTTDVIAGGVDVVEVFDAQGEIDYLNQLADDLSAYLTENGVNHTVETGEVRYVQWDLDDEATNQLVDEFLTDNAGFEFFDLEDISEEEIAEIGAEADAMRNALDDAGITYELETDPLGIEWPVFDEDNEAAWEAIDQAFEDMFTAELKDLSDEELAEIRADIQPEADAMRNALDDAGITYELETDPLGIEWPVFDEDNEAAWEAIDQAFEDMFTAELKDLSDEELAEIRADIQPEADAMRNALDDAGITYELETDPLGIEWPVFDEDNEAAWEAIDKVFKDMFPFEFDEEFLFDTDVTLKGGPASGLTVVGGPLETVDA